MSNTSIARLFRNGRSQAVRLPREFRFKGDRVRVRAVPGGVLLEPLFTDPSEWFRELDRLKAGRFMAGGRQGRQQPPTASRKIFE
jgi:antitoxin VapB